MRIVNPTTSPVPVTVTNAGQATSTRWKQEVLWGNPPSDTADIALGAAVPAGKRLVIEQVALKLGAAPGEVFELSIVIGDALYFLAPAHRMTQLHPDNGTPLVDRYYYSGSVLAYGDPGSYLVLRVSNFTKKGWFDVQGVLSGHLESA